MRACLLLVLSSFFLLSVATGQNIGQNMGFETIQPGKSLPDHWLSWSSSDYQIVPDSTICKSGKYSIRIEATGKDTTLRTSGSIIQTTKARYAGQTLQLKAWMKYENIEYGSVHLFIYIDGQKKTLAVDRMFTQNLHGTCDWQLYTTTVPYPPNAEIIYFGAQNNGIGRLWVDDLQLLLDGKDFAQLEAEYSQNSPSSKQNTRSSLEKVSEFHPIRTDQTTEREQALQECRQQNQAPANLVKAHPAAAFFPGKVTTPKRITRTIHFAHTPVPAAIKHITKNISSLNGNTMHSTGLYAAPGETITLEIPEQLKGKLNVQIGCHSDNLDQWSAAHEDWRRMPCIVRVDPLNKKTTRTASAFGGLIYLTCSTDTPACEGDIIIRNAVAAPYFILGETTTREWFDKLSTTGAPWGEIEGNNMILTLSTASLKKIGDPAQSIQLWDQVVNACYDLAQIPTPFYRKQRIITDIHIGIGYLHNGYPIMGTHCPSLNMICEDVLSQSEYILNPTKSFSGWGFFHEIGHNMQNWKDWVFQGSAEVSVNFFSLYIFDHIMRGRTNAHPAIEGKATQEMISTYFANGAKFSDWQEDAFLGLAMFRQIQTDFGWETFKKVFRRFHEENARNNNPPHTNQEKIDNFVIYLSDATQRNLFPFFSTWGIPVSEKCAELLKQYPQWMPFNFPPKPD